MLKEQKNLGSQPKLEVFFSLALFFARSTKSINFGGWVFVLRSAENILVFTHLARAAQKKIVILGCLASVY